MLLLSLSLSLSLRRFVINIEVVSVHRDAIRTGVFAAVNIVFLTVLLGDKLILDQ